LISTTPSLSAVTGTRLPPESVTVPLAPASGCPSLSSIRKWMVLGSGSSGPGRASSPLPSSSSLKVYSPAGTSVSWISPATSVITAISAPSESVTVPLAPLSGFPAASSTLIWMVVSPTPGGISTVYAPGGLSSMWTCPSLSVSASITSPEARRIFTFTPASALPWSSWRVKSMASFGRLPAFGLGAP